MAAIVRYLTHPQVEMDVSVPVPSWGLSPVGRQRAQALADAGWLTGTTRIVASGERKAIETAEPIAAALGIGVEIVEAMHENDRSATGFLPPNEFETVANEFFAYPERSVRGWERAVDAQARIVRETEHVLNRAPSGDVLLVGHGAVGTLLFCHYAKLLIARCHDQPGGGGNYWAIGQHDRRLLHPWRPIEQAP